MDLKSEIIESELEKNLLMSFSLKCKVVLSTNKISTGILLGDSCPQKKASYIHIILSIVIV